MRKVGIDEAGRCPVVGSLFQVGILCTCSEEEEELRSLGVQDSKKLTAKKREEIGQKILDWSGAWATEWKTDDGWHGQMSQSVAKHEFNILCKEWWPSIIDSYVYNHRLNNMEAIGIGYIAKELKAEHIIAHRIQRSGINDTQRREIHYQTAVPIEVVDSEDDNPIVAAASILATWQRTMHMQDIRKKYPDVGSGEPADKKTRAFIKYYVDHATPLPPIIRTEWETVKRIIMQNIIDVASSIDYRPNLDPPKSRSRKSKNPQWR